MARSKRTFWEAKPRKPIRYGLSARIVDWRAGPTVSTASRSCRRCARKSRRPR